MSKEIEPSRRAGEIFWWINNHLLSLEIEGRDNIQKAKEHLKSGSIIGYFNHISLFDPGLILRLVNDIFGERVLQRTAAFTSQKHLDPERGKLNSIQGFIMKSGSLAKGFELLPIVQEYDRQFYPNYRRVNYSSVRRVIDEFLKTSNSVVLLAPEETRSRTGQLLEAKDGIEVLLRHGGDNVLTLPIGVVGTRELHLPKLQALSPKGGKIIIGEPISYQEAEAQARFHGIKVKDVLMLRLAALLPYPNRGHYADFTI